MKCLQWNDFKALSAKRIISFGGWGYSTEPATYDRLREAMTEANRMNFVNNIISFLNKEGLDGVDFDWEYPGVSDDTAFTALTSRLTLQQSRHQIFLGSLLDKLLMGLITFSF